MTIDSHGATHKGLVRPGNEDDFYVGRWAFAVADGVGGAPAGEVASALAVAEVAAVDGETPTGAQDASDRLAGAVQAAAQAVASGVEQAPQRAGMATTLTAAGVWDGQLALAHVGDSRGYLLHEGALEQLTRDDTAVEEAVEAGILERGDAAHHPERHLLVNVVGADPSVSVAAPQPRPVSPGDRVLLCSDGLTEVCDADTITAVLEGSEHADEATAQLIERALERGAPDNVTVVVLTV